MTSRFGYVECRGHFFELTYKTHVFQVTEGDRILANGKILVLREFSNIDFTVKCTDHHGEDYHIDIDEMCFTLKRVEKPSSLEECVLII